MGNNLAPSLAIIYMNELPNWTQRLLEHIDDIFLAWTLESISGELLLDLANNLNDAIKFTIEMPTENDLAFLDTLVLLIQETNQFSTTLFVKPIHSHCITPWDSHGSITSKRSIARLFN